jgi:hypothetical protein
VGQLGQLGQVGQLGQLGHWVNWVRVFTMLVGGGVISFLNQLTQFMRPYGARVSNFANWFNNNSVDPVT